MIKFVALVIIIGLVIDKSLEDGEYYTLSSVGHLGYQDCHKKLHTSAHSNRNNSYNNYSHTFSQVVVLHGITCGGKKVIPKEEMVMPFQPITLYYSTHHILIPLFYLWCCTAWVHSNISEDHRQMQAV